MKRLSIVLCLSIFTPIFLCAKPTKVRTTSYNIRRDGKETTPERTWKQRMARVVAVLKKNKPDIMGLQESTKGQVEDLKKELEGYQSFGDSRNSKMSSTAVWQRIGSFFGTDEYNPIFYNTKRFEAREKATFGINNTGPTGWLPRICTCGLFKDKQTDQEVYVYNTHLDHMFHDARVNGLRTILADIKERTAKNPRPVVLIGDFNTPCEGEVKDLLVESGFAHAREVAEKTKGPKHTSTGWEGNDLRTIDHILILSRQNASVAKYVVIETPGEYPSDHRPVSADVQFGQD